jgi:hypothetical protein
MTDRQLEDMEVKIDPNGVAYVKLTGYKSEAEKVAKAVADAFAEKLVP